MSGQAAPLRHFSSQSSALHHGSQPRPEVLKKWYDNAMRFNRSGQDARISQLAPTGALLMLIGGIVGFAFKNDFTARSVGAVLMMLGWLTCGVVLNMVLRRQAARSTAFRIFIWILLLAIVGFQIMSLWFGWLAQRGPASSGS
ncbi:hypothetical protein E7T06_18345 [Deinococcus sp. Arct2-2]|uniref:hypothetical protein n=1 Tax=Deinococcus sp. Arct2-2 TaxID=2568653 RepID=UPI00113F1AE8|nr:hypothetical protein [Deinococcus sp. Arct2-2]THF68001.1 hypothetical protein E7T06_18345 [Deinococcus sp. Arct2-2]